ncbi:polysaccharide deacetylase family protein [Pullulanibacillus sp. KACC 23026]|uniref:polysaccharide deacetylase family protein n=1 Tax=Pullulanibacillus sp. KACC 23026 TaxID=3028315 RepID=UPI0023AE85BD|nr:polysaccharide deacetylase family protein [Pullulanibacillus sp. KACC 23026]WEG12545.1 polysaccharide deacetylase family protein [Pullulanibacillus sp. KACC 23026]
MLMLGVIILAVLILYIIYTLLPTFVMRLFSLGVLNRSSVPGKMALTFDDGPDPEYTPQLLDLLAEYQAKATFFVVGEFAEQYPDLVRRMVNEGHEVGTHHYRHLSTWLLTPIDVKRQCYWAGQVVEKITGQAPYYYRPPWGHLNLFSYWTAKPFRMVIWTAILGDWNLGLGSERLLKRLKKHARNGAIICLHDCGKTPGAHPNAPANTLKALKPFLEEYHHRFKFVTIRELDEAGRHEARAKA